MIIVSLHFFSGVREALDMKRMDLELNEEACLQDLLDELCRRFGDRFNKILYRHGSDDLFSNITIFINGVNACVKDGLKTKLKNRDFILLLTPIAGGTV